MWKKIKSKRLNWYQATALKTGMRNVALNGRAKEGIKMIEYQKGEREEYKLYDRGVQEREEKMGWGEKKF